MEVEDETIFTRVANMVRMQTEATKEGIEAMMDEMSRLWKQRMDESDDRIQVLEARIASLKLESDRIQVLEAQIASLQLIVGVSKSAQSSVCDSSSYSGACSFCSE